MILLGKSGTLYTTDSKPFSSGGEGDVYSLTGMPDKVAKIYHPDRITAELEQKLEVMAKRPPSSKVLSQVAWPLDIVYSNSQFCGFVMPRLNITDDLSAIYGYPPQKRISYKAKIIIAQNICAVISEVHKAGYVFGDFNPQNIGIDINSCRVAFLDTDSYHITNGGTTFRCKVCKDGYVAPELLKKCEAYKKDAYATAPLPTFTKETDNFALAIHIFKLLMNGFTPFNGIKETESASTASPGVGNQAVSHNNYCFKPGNKPQADAVPPLDILPEEISDLFTRAFLYGQIDPSQRPGAAEWHKALLNYENSLVPCSNNSAHLYKAGLANCPWCEADERYSNALLPGIIQKPYSGAVVTAQSSSAASQKPVFSSTGGGQSVSGTVYSPPVRAAGSGSKTIRGKTKVLAIAAATVVALVVVISLFSEKPTRSNTGSNQSTQAFSQASSGHQSAHTPEESKDTHSVVTTIESGVEVENNNSSGNANEILVNSKYSGSLSASHSSEQDWYCFNLKEAGKVIVNFYTKSQPSSGAYWDISVRSGNNPNSDVWQTFVNGDATTTKSSELYLSAGSYYFEVESSNNHTTDNYSFEINFSELQAYSAQEIQNGKYVAEDLNLQTVSCSPANVLQWNGNFISEKQTDEFPFTAERSGVYSIFFTDILEGQEFPIQVLDASGKAISNQYMNSTYGLGEGVDLTLSQGQQYTVKVRQSSNYYGAYCLNVGTQKEYIDVSNCYAVYDTIEYIKQQNGYYFTPSVTGDYRFGFSDIPEGFEYCIQVVNPGGDAISNQYWNSTYGNKEGQTVKLTAGQSYLVKVKQYSKYYGDYCLDIGLYKNTGDISSFFAVDDTIQHIGQRNLYTFVPQLTTSYEFGISNVPAGCEYLIQVVNAGGNAISNQYWNSSYGNNESQSVNLSKGETYTIIVRPASTGFGSYTLNIGSYKDAVDISEFDDISDSLQYRLQRNQYTFTPQTTGTYQFILSNIPSGYEYMIQVWNAAGDAISNQYWNSTYGNDEGQSVDLTGGQTYTIIVRQNATYLSDYVLTVKAK